MLGIGEQVLIENHTLIADYSQVESKRILLKVSIYIFNTGTKLNAQKLKTLGFKESLTKGA